METQAEVSSPNSIEAMGHLVLEAAEKYIHALVVKGLDDKRTLRRLIRATTELTRMRQVFMDEDGEVQALDPVKFVEQGIGTDADDPLDGAAAPLSFSGPQRFQAPNPPETYSARMLRELIAYLPRVIQIFEDRNRADLRRLEVLHPHSLEMPPISPLERRTP